MVLGGGVVEKTALYKVVIPTLIRINLFQTELYGIKWRKLVWGETSGGGEGEEGGAPLADPVISSYARCLAGDILCVWRRVPAPPPLDLDMGTAAPPPLSLRASKELWIFWYGEEPDLNGLVAPELIASREYLPTLIVTSCVFHS